jgi:hypothetical protein
MFFAAAAVAGAKITVLNEAPKLMVESGAYCKCPGFTNFMRSMVKNA